LITGEEIQTSFPLEEFLRKAGSLGKLDGKCKEHNKTLPQHFISRQPR